MVCEFTKIFKHFESTSTKSPQPITSFALLAAESRVRIRYEDVQLLRPLDDSLSLLCGHVVRYFGAVSSV